MTIESIRIASNVQILITHAIEYKLKIREIFARTMVVEFFPDLVEAFTNLSRYESYYLGTSVGQEKLKQKALEVSDIVHGHLLSEEYDCINRIVEICE